MREELKKAIYAESMAYSYCVENCPKCKAANWFSERDYEDALHCWKCDHRWIYFGDETLFEMFCEDNGIREGLSEEWLEDVDESRIEYETLDEYLAAHEGHYGKGSCYENCSTTEQRKRLYEELKKEFVDADGRQDTVSQSSS